MGDNPSTFKGGRKPVENVTWWKALEFCNKLSIKEGLEPVYKLEEDDFKVIHLDGEEVYPYLADFSKTEGYRLPTVYEWEWFASGGEEAIKNNTFDTKYAGSDIENVVAWSSLNASNQTHDVGLKKMNELGLYDCSGNVLEWCYDTSKYLKYMTVELPVKYYHYDSTEQSRVLKGGSWLRVEFLRLFSFSFEKPGDYCEIKSEITQDPNNVELPSSSNKYKGVIGFRVVRTANPKY